jgi:hypothetical protein
MKKHAFDPVSFIFGALFLLGGIPLLAGDSAWDFFEQKWVFPSFLVVAGLVILLTSQLSGRTADDDADDTEVPIR